MLVLTSLLGVIIPTPDDIYAELTIHAFYGSNQGNNISGNEIQSGGGNSLFGHCFLSFANYSGSSLYFGHVNVPHFTTITLGVFLNGYHEGLFYNYEGVDTDSWKNDAAATLTILLTPSQISTLNGEIQNSGHNCWTISHTCSTFAAEVWNTVAPAALQVTDAILPSIVKASIESKSGHGSSTYVPVSSPVGYIDSNQDFVPISI